ncbi:Reverse transcriptase zinc-binding domain [Arabidopsis thaliana x Arabidopsis arenosa]|uniref:Reverse transcriptase zinc-binding domain n=1 Tax=Arabidopsis thaliana x Arabidopsis arenosa TaxID=1240361 RepID=A0A8T2A547_9BRAS|nr:Reverse transcriptase zinc-binding domain [Arabidopsis thaliana x Arabidopsis arenosa]
MNPIALQIQDIIDILPNSHHFSLKEFIILPNTSLVFSDVVIGGIVLKAVLFGAEVRMAILSHLVSTSLTIKVGLLLDSVLTLLDHLIGDSFLPCIEVSVRLALIWYVTKGFVPIFCIGISVFADVIWEVQSLFRAMLPHLGIHCLFVFPKVPLVWSGLDDQASPVLQGPSSRLASSALVAELVTLRVALDAVSYEVFGIVLFRSHWTSFVKLYLAFISSLSSFGVFLGTSCLVILYFPFIWVVIPLPLTTHLSLQDDEIVQPPKGSVELKKEVWKLKIPPKIQHFLWKCISGAVSTATQLRTRTIPADPTCQRCCQDDETINHILFTCTYAQTVWRCANTNFGYHLNAADLEDNLNMLIQLYKDKQIPLSNRLLPFWMLWRIWKSRNMFLFQKKNKDPASEASKSNHDVQEWIETMEVQSSDESNTLNRSDVHGHDRTRSRQWIPPPPGWYKCNFDSGFVQGRAFTNTGWIIRDDSGKAILSGYAKLQEAHSTLQAEAMGFLHVLQVCWAQGLRFIWFEGDNSELIKLINTGGDHNEIGTLLYDIRFWMTKLPYSSLDYTNRERNEAADVLAKHASLADSLYQTFSVPPCWLLNYLYPPFTV